jgi:hypothetical protein
MLISLFINFSGIEPRTHVLRNFLVTEKIKTYFCWKKETQGAPVSLIQASVFDNRSKKSTNGEEERSRWTEEKSTQAVD